MKNIFKDLVVKHNLKGVRHLSHVDADGYTCSLLVGDAINDLSVKYTPLFTNYGEEMENKIGELIQGWEVDTLLVITDLGITQDAVDIIDSMIKVGYHAIYIDHHVTKVDVDKYQWIYHHKDMSATMITWGLCGEPEDYSMLIRCVNDADIFVNKEDIYFKLGRRISYLLNSLNSIPYKFNESAYKWYSAILIRVAIVLNDYDHEELEWHTIKLMSEYYSPLTLMDAAIETIVKEVQGNTIPSSANYLILSNAGNISDIADALFYNVDGGHQHVDFVINFSKSGGVSVRSRDGMHRNAHGLAMHMSKDGGGHPNAAGFYCKLEEKEYLKVYPTLPADILKKIEEYMV